jgi:hypothetical protein
LLLRATLNDAQATDLQGIAQPREFVIELRQVQESGVESPEDQQHVLYFVLAAGLCLLIPSWAVHLSRYTASDTNGASFLRKLLCIRELPDMQERGKLPGMHCLRNWDKSGEKETRG